MGRASIRGSGSTCDGWERAHAFPPRLGTRGSPRFVRSSFNWRGTGGELEGNWRALGHPAVSCADMSLAFLRHPPPFLRPHCPHGPHCCPPGPAFFKLGRRAAGTRDAGVPCGVPRLDSIIELYIRFWDVTFAAAGCDVTFPTAGCEMLGHFFSRLNITSSVPK